MLPRCGFCLFWKYSRPTIVLAWELSENLKAQKGKKREVSVIMNRKPSCEMTGSYAMICFWCWEDSSFSVTKHCYFDHLKTGAPLDVFQWFFKNVLLLLKSNIPSINTVKYSTMLVLLVPTVQQYLTSNLTVPQHLPNAHKSKGVNENMYM